MSNPCNHHSRAEAMDCPLFRARRAERIFPLHGANAFTWQLSLEQDAIMGSIAHFDPHPIDVEHVFGPIRFIFEDDAEYFAEELFHLRALGLVWIDCDSGLVGYSEEGREHVQAQMAANGGSLQTLRLIAQANFPSTFNYSIPLVDRVIALLADREMVHESVTGEYAKVTQ